MLSETVVKRILDAVAELSSALDDLQHAPTVDTAEKACMASRIVQGALLPDWEEFQCQEPDACARFVDLLRKCVEAMDLVLLPSGHEDQIHLEHARISTLRRSEAFDALLNHGDFDQAMAVLTQPVVV